jgi:hypothetical protein
LNFCTPSKIRNSKSKTEKQEQNKTCNSKVYQDTRYKHNSKSKLQEYGVSKQLFVTFKADRKTDYQKVHQQQ